MRRSKHFVNRKTFHALMEGWQQRTLKLQKCSKPITRRSVQYNWFHWYFDRRKSFLTNVKFANYWFFPISVYRPPIIFIFHHENGLFVTLKQCQPVKRREMDVWNVWILQCGTKVQQFFQDRPSIILKTFTSTILELFLSFLTRSFCRLFANILSIP